MAVTLTSFQIEYAGNGSTTEFPVPFSFLEPEHLRAIITHDGEETTLLPGSGFTTEGAGEGEGQGSVIFDEPPPAGSTVRIVRIVPLTQLTDWRAQGPFSPELWERALDLLTMICQQINGGAIDPGNIVAGEVNVGENVNSVGVGVYDGKSGVRLRFRGIVGGEGISVTLNDTTKAIEISTSLSDDEPNPIGTANAAGTAEEAARADHTHAHGELGGGDLHAVATLAAAGFMSPAQVQALEDVNQRPVAVPARAHYHYNGSAYVLRSAYDPRGIFPALASPSGSGEVTIIFESALKTADFRRQISAGIAIDNNAAFGSSVEWSEDHLTIRFASRDGPIHVRWFDVWVDDV